MSTPKQICYECGHGDISPKTGIGRTENYRGIIVKIPDDLPIRRCDVCCCSVMNSQEIDVFSEICESQRLAHISAKDKADQKDEAHGENQSSDHNLLISHRITFIPHNRTLKRQKVHQETEMVHLTYMLYGAVGFAGVAVLYFVAYFIGHLWLTTLLGDQRAEGVEKWAHGVFVMILLSLMYFIGFVIAH